MDRTELHRKQSEAIQLATAQALRLLKETEQASPAVALMERPWFPWVAMPCAVALGAALALGLSR